MSCYDPGPSNRSEEHINYFIRVPECKAEQNPEWYSGVDRSLHFLDNEIFSLRKQNNKLQQELEGMWAHVHALEQKLANKEVNEKLDCLTLNTTWAWGGPLPASCTIRGFQDDQNS